MNASLPSATNSAATNSTAPVAAHSSQPNRLQKPNHSQNRARPWAAWLAVVALASLLGVWMGRWQVFAALDGALYNYGIISNGRKQVDNIVIIGLDDKFIEQKHVRLLPRDKLARLISIVAQGKPAVIALDWWLDSFVDGDKKPSDLKGQDAQLKRAIADARKSGVPVLLPQVPLDDDGKSQSDAAMTGLTEHGSTIPYFLEVASGEGVVLFPENDDGIYRELPLSSDEAPSLPYMAATFAPKLARALTPEVRARVQRESTPIDFVGGPGAITINPSSKVLEEPAIAYLLEGKIIFIGATFARSGDFLKTPYNVTADTTQPTNSNRTPPGAQSTLSNREMYGVELLAQSTSTLLRGAPRYSAQAPAARLKMSAVAVVVAAIVTAGALAGVGWGVLAGVVAIAFAGGMAAVSAREPVALLGSHFWPAAPSMLSAMLALTMATAYRQVTIGRELRQVKAVFDGYVGDQILQQLGGKMPKLGGETWNIAVLFCDIEGFSALSESMRDDPERLLSTLNDHFQPLVKALQDRGGHVDNYVGDLVMALFGAPIPADSLSIDTRNAVWAAIDFIEIIKARNKERRVAGEPIIEVGIGVHCGSAVVGNMGSQRKMHYTAIGDNVNLASRVESATRQYHTPLLVTEEVVQAFDHNIDQLDPKQRLEWEFVAETTVKGRLAPVRLYRPKV